MHHEYGAEEEKSPCFDEMKLWLSVKQWRFCYYLFIVYWSEYGNNVAFVIWIKSVSLFVSFACRLYVNIEWGSKVTVWFKWCCLVIVRHAVLFSLELFVTDWFSWSCGCKLHQCGPIYSEEKLYEIMFVLELKTLHMKQMLCSCSL